MVCKQLCLNSDIDIDNIEAYVHSEENFPSFDRNMENSNEHRFNESILISEYNDSSDNNNVVNFQENETDDPLKELNDIRLKNPNRLIVAQLNINSLRNKFTSLSTIIKDKVDILLVSETKIDSSFPTAQFHIQGYTTYRHDRNEYGGGLLLYVREDIPSTLLKTDSN